jgi:siroheme synthase-like protein
MLPVMLDVSRLPIVLAGAGPALLRRLERLDAAQADHVRVFSSNANTKLREQAGARLTERFPTGSDFANVSLVFIAGLPKAHAQSLADLARQRQVLVHVEDEKQLCDFYFPSVLRRGDLVISVSTSGSSPTLARVVREQIEESFGKEWAGYTHELAQQRLAWRAGGRTPQEVEALSREYIKTQGWLRALHNEEEVA